MCIAGEKPLNSEPQLPLVPIHVVTRASQLPAEFLEPSAERQLVIGFDCEGVDLCRHGTLCIMQVCRVLLTLYSYEYLFHFKFRSNQPHLVDACLIQTRTYGLLLNYHKQKN